MQSIAENLDLHVVLFILLEFPIQWTSQVGYQMI